MKNKKQFLWLVAAFAIILVTGIIGVIAYYFKDSSDRYDAQFVAIMKDLNTDIIADVQVEKNGEIIDDLTDEEKQWTIDFVTSVRVGNSFNATIENKSTHNFYKISLTNISDEVLDIQFNNGVIWIHDLQLKDEHESEYKYAHCIKLEDYNEFDKHFGE